MDKKKILEQIEKNVASCTKCRLCKFAKNPVPGEGNINAKIVFIGEAPGETEDETGRPFVGRAGRLLEALLKEIGYERKDVWIGNILKHRPPGNREPFADEITACEPYLTMQLKAIDPVLIVTLGRFGMYYFYKEGKISRDHGRLIRVNGLSVFPIYHPAAALRNPEFARALKEDFLKVPRILEGLEKGEGGFVPENVAIQKKDDPGQLGLF